MTDKEKAIAYNEALERAKMSYHTGDYDKNTLEMLEIIFPELKESEDERVRKALIDFFNRGAKNGEQTNGVCDKDILTWLEKQSSNAYELNYKEGVRTKNKEWIEKQNEQEHIIAPKFSIGDIIRNKITNEVFTIADRCILLEYYCDINHLHEVKFSEQDDWEIVKAAADTSILGMIEPKFKVGDWITDGYLHNKITDVLEDRYIVETKYIKRSAILFEHESRYHLWTIKDAKDGDVLSDGTTIFIFKDLLSDGSVMSYCDYDYDTDSGESDAFCPLLVNLICSKITPATKEQRDLLFQKMKEEAGYKWDAEKKEAKKIENEIEIPFGAKDSELQEVTYNIPKGFHAEINNDKVVIKKDEKSIAWSEEDENIHRKLHNLIYAVPYCDSRKEFSDWLESLKDRVQPQWKPSDEQMNALDSTLQYSQVSHNSLEHLNSLFNDLKKLREE